MALAGKAVLITSAAHAAVFASVPDEAIAATVALRTIDTDRPTGS